MRILVYGAGVLGGNLADSLYRSGRDVTLLARGAWYDEIRKNGLSIHHFFGRKTRSRIPVIDELMPEDLYDAIFVVVRYTQIDTVIPALRSNNSENIVFTGNDLRAEEIEDMLPGKRVMFAFASSAGHREKDHIESVTLNRITAGNLKGEPSCDDFIKSVFEKTKIRADYEPNMGDWLLCHAASVIPIAFACYHTDGDLRKVKNDRTYLGKVMDATIEAYRVLEDSGHEILPESDKGYRDPGFKKKYMPFYRIICATKLGKLCTSDHAMNAADEMSALNRDFKRYIGMYGPVPDAWLELELGTNGYMTEEET